MGPNITRSIANAGYQYVELSDPSEQSALKRDRCRRITVDITPLCLVVVALSFIVSCIISFMLGKWFSRPVQYAYFPDTQEFLGLQHNRHNFTYNPLYASLGNLTTDKAWLDLFPYQGGFFQHPQIAPKRATFAVYHQLHCLSIDEGAHINAQENIRQAFAALQRPDATATPSHHTAHAHIQHCIELLRETLTCQPDLTVEFVDEELGGVTGFGTEHVCVDWQGLVAWTSKWENYGQEQ